MEQLEQMYKNVGYTSWGKITLTTMKATIYLRIMVSCWWSLQWEGDGSLQKSKETTEEQAYTNQSIRERISACEEVEKYFHSFKMEDGSVVRLDKDLASEQVRSALNSWKKKERKENKEEERQNNTEVVQYHYNAFVLFTDFVFFLSEYV